MTMPTVPSFDELTSEQKLLLVSLSINDLGHKVTKHHKLLVDGNGELPLPERVRNLEKFAGGIQFWYKTIAVALVLQTITFGGAAIIYFVRLYPLLSELAKKP